MTELEEIEPDTLVKTLKQLMISFEPHIRTAGSWDQVEDVLLHLEQNDRNFHRYEFVKLLQKHISDNIGELVSGEIDKFNGGQHEVKGQTPLVSQISDQVINSQQFRELFRIMKISLSDASNQLLENFDAEFCAPFNSRENSFDRVKVRPGFCSDEEDESCFNSLNQGSLVFLSADYFNQTVENLNKSNLIEIRKDAMHRLNQIPVVDIAGSERWKVLRNNLLDVLGHSDPHLASLGMKFVTRAFSSTTSKTSEIFSLLCDHIIHQFMAKKNVTKITSGLDTSNTDIITLIKAFRLILEFQKEAPIYWVRYPNRFMSEIITSTLDLYSLNSHHNLTPLHFISLIDPTADWFIKWMHAKYSREPLLAKLNSYKPMIESAIRSCLRYGSYTTSSSTSSDTQTTRRGNQVYQEAELQYAYFIHSIHILGQLMLFSNGRSFFPFHLPDEHDAVSIRDIVLCFIRLITSPTQSANQDEVPDSASDSAHSQQSSSMYDPARLATEIVKTICRDDQACSVCICKNEVIQALTQPLHHVLSKSTEAKQRVQSSEQTMLQIADILSMIASTAYGRSILLFGEHNTIHNRSRSAAAHIIAQFTRKALRNECRYKPSHLIIGDFLYISRQLYSTSEGLVVLHQYALHDCVTSALMKVKDEIERGETPTVSDSESDKTVTRSEDKKNLQWEDTIKDNLLNFASTAKGLLLLQQTGLMNDCVFYMYTRFANKLQVSKCEKFGYGCMVTLVATTSPGIVALRDAGFLAVLISEAWVLLECGQHSQVSYAPKVWPVEPIDRHVHKPLIRLLNVLSSFPAVYEALKGQILQNKSTYDMRSAPSTIADLIDRIMIVSTESKIQSLFNYEQSHMFGLKILCVMISCLDTFLLLESQYKFTDEFTRCQKTNVSNDSKNIIIDMLSIERNYILVKSFMIGGPSERILPPRYLEEDVDEPYPHPMFIATPIAKCYSPTMTVKNPKQETEMSKFLADFRKKGEKDGVSWLKKCSAAFESMISKHTISNNTTYLNLLEQTVNVLTNKADATIFPHINFQLNDKALKTISLSPLQQNGVKVVVRYGLHLKLISNPSDSEHKLTKLITMVTLFLQRQLAHIQSDLVYLNGPYPGFDWFATTIFLINGGHIEKTWRMLHKLSTLSACAYLWPARLHASVHVRLECASSGISPLFYRTAHNIELVLQTELPLVVSAFRMSGYTPAQICVSWLRQCFWNYLDWSSILEYITICLLFGVDYQVYICVAILKHLSGDIYQHTQDQDLIIFLKEEPIRDFHFGDYMGYMKCLEDKFRHIILPEMLNFSKI